MGKKAKNQDEDKILREIAIKHEQFILKNLNLVYFFSRNSSRFGIPIEDMMQMGFVAILKTIRDHDGKNKFSTYFKWKFVGEISRAQKTTYYPGPFRMPVHFWDWISKISRCVKEQKEKYGRHPDVAEISKSTGAGESLVKHTQEFLQSRTTSLSKNVYEDSEETYADFFPDQIPYDQEDLLILCDWAKKFIFELKKGLSFEGKNRAIIVRRIGFIDCENSENFKASLNDVAKLFGISRERVRQIEARFARKVHCKMDFENEYGVEKKKTSEWIRNVVSLIRELDAKYEWGINFESPN